jgi:retron-type reverse transcriptase
LEPILEEYFHPDSYGYRPKKSAIEAIGVARQAFVWRLNSVLLNVVWSYYHGK